MQTLVQVACTKGPSLRDKIAGDQRLAKYDLEVVLEKKPGRSPGWTKVRSSDAARRGALNIEWHGASATLTCRIVNRGAGRPNTVIGDFVDYLLKCHPGRIRVVTVLPGK